MKRSLLALALLPTLILGCGRSQEHAQPQEKNRGGDHGHHHAHAAPHGGTAVELGEEAFHLELVQDTENGVLTAFLLDGHMEQFVRSGEPSLTLEITVNGARESLVLQAVANPATDETVGDTSQFEGRAEWLKHHRRFEGKILAVRVRGTTFENVPFRVPDTGE